MKGCAPDEATGGSQENTESYDSEAWDAVLFLMRTITIIKRTVMEIQVTMYAWVKKLPPGAYRYIS